MEFLFGGLILAFSCYILYKNIRKKASSSGCDCGSCSSHCPHYDTKGK